MILGMGYGLVLDGDERKVVRDFVWLRLWVVSYVVYWMVLCK